MHGLNATFRWWLNIILVFRNGHLKRNYLVIYHFISELHLQASTYIMSNKAVSVNSVNAYGEAEIQLHSFLNSALHGSKKFQRRKEEGFTSAIFEFSTILIHGLSYMYTVSHFSSILKSLKKVWCLTKTSSCILSALISQNIQNPN
jgi:hypothetical protein